MTLIGEHLRKLRGSKSLRTIAKAADISHAYLSILEKGMDPRNGSPLMPSPDTLKGLSKALNEDYESLMKIAGYIDDNSETMKSDSDKDYKELISLVPGEVAKEFADLPEEKREEIVEHLIFNIKNSLRKLEKDDKSK